MKQETKAIDICFFRISGKEARAVLTAVQIQHLAIPMIKAEEWVESWKGIS